VRYSLIDRKRCSATPYRRVVQVPFDVSHHFVEFLLIIDVREPIPFRQDHLDSSPPVPVRSRDRSVSSAYHGLAKIDPVVRHDNPRLRLKDQQPDQVDVHEGSRMVCPERPQLRLPKKAVMPSAAAAGSSAGAKCPPRGKTVQRWMLYTRSRYERGGSPSGTV
jgi:hypothetical protein